MRKEGWVMKVSMHIFVIVLITAIGFIVLIGCMNNKKHNRVMESGVLAWNVENDKIDSVRTKRAIELSGLMSTMKIREMFNRYNEYNSQLPQQCDWCNRLMEYYEEDGLVKQYLFNIPQLSQWGTLEYHFAYNNNLNQLSVKDLPGNLVLVFEADGEFNLSGGPELLEKAYAKSRYFPGEDMYIYILFFDGTIAKYRLHDGAIALAKKSVYEVSDYGSFGYAYEEEKAFSNYCKKGETPYSPLKWEK